MDEVQKLVIRNALHHQNHLDYIYVHLYLLMYNHESSIIYYLGMLSYHTQ
jgi:hypothetical protein